MQVVQAPLVVAASSGSMSYGGTPPTITPKYTGFVNGESESVLNSAPACTTAATSSSPVGTYSSTCSGGSDNNYAFSYVPGQVVVGPSVLVISRIVGYFDLRRDPVCRHPVVLGVPERRHGFVAHDEGDLHITGEHDQPRRQLRKQLLGGCRPELHDRLRGRFPARVTASATVQASSATMVYGSTPPAITPTVTGLVNGEGVSVFGSGLHCGTAAAATSNVGSYASACSGASDPNYTVTYASGTVTVTPAVLTVTANNQTMQFGTSVPALSATITGFVNGQTLSTSGVTGQPELHDDGDAHQPGRGVPDRLPGRDAQGHQLQLPEFAPGTLTVTAYEGPGLLHVRIGDRGPRSG